MCRGNFPPARGGFRAATRSGKGLGLWEAVARVAGSARGGVKASRTWSNLAKKRTGDQAPEAVRLGAL